MEEKNKFTWQGITLTYKVFGEGSDKMLAFHGFGQDASVYQLWETETGKSFTIYSINLFFHGSEWPYTEQPLESVRIKELFDAFLKENKIKKFSLLAYSIGARLGFELVKIWPERISRVMLIAPDGIKLNFWYKLATGFPPATRLFRYSVHNPGIFLNLLEWAGKLKLIHPSMGRFVLSQMRNNEKREKVYFTWMVFRRIKTRLNSITQIVGQYKLEVFIFAGENDNVIPLQPLRKFARKMETCRLVMLPVSHQQLIDSTAAWIRDHPGLL